MSDCRIPPRTYRWGEVEWHEPVNPPIREQGYDTLHMRIDFKGEEQPWMYPLALNGREIEKVTIGGKEYQPVRECEVVNEKRTLRSMMHGEHEVVDEKCSECGGYMETGCGVIRNCCPTCGARVKGSES
ncbi:MAG: hypothetical protein IJ111_01400 [Eggerthellaceae bacterium]|nr:hypothetical protein [Eggerthellaceae bacterium]